VTKHTERIGACDNCDRVEMTARFRGRDLCRRCLLADEIPARIEDHAGYTGPLGYAGEMVDDAALGYGNTKEFHAALDRALVKHGLNKTQQDLKDEMWHR